jgi:hypothetical protein
MKKEKIIIRTIATLSVCLCILSGLQAQNRSQEDTVFYRSLHYTAKGMSYWYDKSNGGLESVTSIPYSQLSCQGCHVSSCDRCHLGETDGVPGYSTKTARQQELCLGCHAREASIFKIDRAANQVDVHVRSGMTCMDCHTAREIHGDGVEYGSMKQPIAMDTRCEKCHTPSASLSHTTHKGKLDCKACHDRQVVSCTNCHFETLMNEGKRVAMPVSGWVFLMNLNGKVTSANMQSFVVEGKKTFLMFAPQHSHSVMAKGRECKECHATKAAREVQRGKVKLTWMQDGQLKNMKGVIPVADKVDWEMVYYEREAGKWVPMNNPAKPKLHYAGFGIPLTRAQMDSLLQLQAEEK